ncbi:MAG: orotidine-5'-phosphate decarboxylase [Deltaproteobacteria bacterium]|nr:orotidine-5'-phosphate decarboxylase [Deltaproteobacteria bacterium]
MNRNKKLIVALDVPDREEILFLAQLLRDEVAMVKIGLEGFVAHGPKLVREIVDLGVEVFLDLKLHDIPRTASAAAKQVSNLGVSLLTIHAAGGAAMVRAVRDSLNPQTALIAVTVLTSLDADALKKIGFVSNTQQTAHTLGNLALANGADGLVCSAHELDALSSLSGVRVVPGVRPLGSEVYDQRRVATPKVAINAGATWIVVGRPIITAAKPLDAAKAINLELTKV